jgi:elongation factor G
MDYMKQERERGITIRSAAITFNWKSYQINLIDTPGHVDFSGEVARSLKVLDGAVTILDGVKGVEAQTIKVWEQARRRNIPRICYVNKLDRMGASILQTAESIKKRLKVEPLLMQMPVGECDMFKGVIDLLSMKQILFEGAYGSIPKMTDVPKTHPKYSELLLQRMNLVEKIGDFDD